MPEINFIVPGIPVAKGRPRFGKGRCFTPQKTVSYEAELKYWFLKSVGYLFKPLDCPIRLSIVAVFHMPKSAPKRDRNGGTRRKITKPDLDNIVKSCADGLNKIAWIDDSLIYSIIAKKIETTGSPFLDVLIEWDTPIPPELFNPLRNAALMARIKKAPFSHNGKSAFYR